jgi:SulP family sulfate permease
VRWEPKLITAFREGYSRESLVRDLIAGVIVGVVALPLSIALAIASGVRPEQGLYTAIVAGFLISVFSGSRVQIGGPTGAFVVLIYATVEKYGYDGLAVATLMAGVLLVVMGLAGLGSVIKFIPYPVTVGFTSGIALLIFSTQIRDLLGLRMGAVPADFVEKWIAYAEGLPTWNAPTAAVGAAALLIAIYWPRVTHRVPGALIAIVATTAAVHIFALPVATIESQLGEVPNSFPVPRFPIVSWERLRELLSPAVSIALLGGIESLLSAVVADGMTGARHDSDTELIAQGLANIASPIFGGIPATGAIARTATNIKNGGRSPLAGITHALVLLAIMLLFGHWAGLIPMATLAAILIVVAYNMSEWHLFVKIFRSPRSDIAVLLTTFLLTVLLDLAVAIQVGVVLASLLFMRRMSQVTQAGYITGELSYLSEKDDPEALSKKTVPDGVEVFEIDGPFFFGAADVFKDALNEVESPPPVLILRMRRVPAMDATGLRALEDVYNKTVHERTKLVLSGVQPQPRKVLEASGLLGRIGEANVHAEINAALVRAVELLAEARPVRGRHSRR